MIQNNYIGPLMYSIFITSQTYFRHVLYHIIVKLIKGYVSLI